MVKEITTKIVQIESNWDRTDLIELLSGKRLGDNKLGEKVDFKKQWEKMHTNK